MPFEELPLSTSHSWLICAAANTPNGGGLIDHHRQPEAEIRDATRREGGWHVYRGGGGGGGKKKKKKQQAVCRCLVIGFVCCCIVYSSEMSGVIYISYL